MPDSNEIAPLTLSVLVSLFLLKSFPQVNPYNPALLSFGNQAFRDAPIFSVDKYNKQKIYI